MWTLPRIVGYLNNATNYETIVIQNNTLVGFRCFEMEGHIWNIVVFARIKSSSTLTTSFEAESVEVFFETQSINPTPISNII